MKISVNAFYLSIIAGIMIFLPSMLMILFHQSSFTLGVVTSSLVIIVTTCFISKSGCRIDKKTYSMLLFIVFSNIFLLLHFIAIYFFPVPGTLPPDVPKFILSFYFIVICTVAAFMTKIVISNVSEYTVHNAAKFILYALIFNAVISVSKIDFFNSGLAKPTFLFLEPSHFALVCAPLLMYFSFTNSGNFSRFLLLFLFASWGLYIQSFTMLLAVMLAYLITMKNLLPGLFFIFLISILGYIFKDNNFLSYYKNRLDFSGDSQNLSLLVLLQGWENAFLTLSRSLFGAGFQQYGTSTVYGNFSEKIYSIMHMYLNTYDAGSVAPKIIGEFGVFGILLLLFYLFSWLRVFYLVRRDRYTGSKKFILFSSIYLSSLLEFFVRGAGYFTPSMFFFVVSVIYFISGNVFKKDISNMPKEVLL